MNDDDDKWTFEEIYAVVQLVLMLLGLWKIAEIIIWIGKELTR